MPVVVSRKKTISDAMAIEARYLRFPDVNCLSAILAERNLPLTGTFSLLSKYTSERPLETALMGDIVPILPEISIIKAAYRISIPKRMPILKMISTPPHIFIPIIGSKTLGRYSTIGIAKKNPITAPIISASIY